jgi:hypothetical protein
MPVEPAQRAELEVEGEEGEEEVHRHWQQRGKRQAREKRQEDGKRG